MTENERGYGACSNAEGIGQSEAIKLFCGEGRFEKNDIITDHNR
jgi:hypothetical protein